MIENNYTIALLIDAENISHSLLDALEEQLTMLGRITVKKCYGDFTKPNMTNWSSAFFINKHALEVVQQHAFTNGKNSSDIRLAIDAIDIGNPLHFCTYVFSFLYIFFKASSSAEVNEMLLLVTPLC